MASELEATHGQSADKRHLLFCCLPERVRVSVIIPVYDDSRVFDCLDCLAKQTYPADLLEVIVVDNGRTQLKPAPGVRWIRTETPGSYRARNKGSELAIGEVLAFTDADCLPQTNWIQRGVEALRMRGGRGVVGGDVQLYPRNWARLTAAEIYELAWGFPQQMFVETLGFAATANLFVHKDAFREIGPFNAEMLSGGDQEWGERATAVGRRPVYDPGVLVRHPARASLGELIKKYLRTCGGQFQLRGQKGMGHGSAALKLLRKPLLVWGQDVPLYVRQRRLRYLGVQLLLSLVQLLELLRLSLGGKPGNS